MKVINNILLILFSLLLWIPVAKAQSLAQENLSNLENLVAEFAAQASEQQQLKDELLQLIELDEDNLDLLRSEEQRYLADGDTARALAIKARLIKYGYDYQDKQIELELYNSLISIFSSDHTTASQLYTTYQNAWLDDPHTADALNHDYYQLLQGNYDAIQQAYNTAAEQRTLLSEQAGNEPVPEGIDALHEIANQTAEAAYYNGQRHQYYKDVLTQIDGLNAGWGMTAAANLLNKQAKNYDLMAEVFQNLNQWVGQSYNQLADQYAGQESTQSISDFYQQRPTASETAPEKLRAIATGMRYQAHRSLALGATFNANAPELDLAQLFGFSIDANEALAEVFSSMSEEEYWQSLYEEAQNDIDRKIEENLAAAIEYESLLAQAQEYESEYVRVTNDENGIQNFTNVEHTTEIPPAPAPTIRTIPNQGSEGYYVGSIAGDIEVGNAGQPTWSMPIDVPPGVRGLAPKLVVSVDANGGAGLSGVSVITRCGASIANDGANRPVDLSINDKYCFNGQPLVVVQGQYGEADSEYRTKIETFEKIVAVGSTGSGPASFMVHTRNGGTMYYGESSSSQTLAGNGVITQWKISRLHDVMGNGIFYRYSNQSSLPGEDEFLLSQIKYGAKSENNASLSVDIEYELRPDISTGYQFGRKYQSTQRLKRITTKAGDRTKRRYTINYALSEVIGSSRVESIQECAGSESSSPCYRPTYFTYTPEDSGWLASSISQPDALQDQQGRSRGVVLDINNDGFNDWVIAMQPETGAAEIQTWLGSANGWVSSSAFNLPGPLVDYQINAQGIPVGNLADMNGDGLVDYFQAYHQTHADGSTTIKRTIWKNTGTGFVEGGVPRPPYYTTFILADGTVEAYDRYVDVNGDGLPDQVRAMRRKSGTYSRITRLNTGSGWQVSTAYKLPAGLLSNHHYGNNDALTGELIDINGDGLVDFIESAKLSSTKNRTYLNTGSGWELSAAYNLPVTLMEYSSGNGLSKAELADINGDGLLDVWQAVKMPDNTFLSSAWLNNGSTFIAAPEFTPPWYSVRHRADGFTDVVGTHLDLDGNGSPEFVLFYRSAENITSMNIWTHNGEQWVNARNELAGKLPNIPFFQHFTNQSSTGLVQFGDLNGDIGPEAYSSIEGISNGQLVYSAPMAAQGEQPGMLIEVTNGLKISTRLEYGVSTSSGLYSPSSAPSVYPNVAQNAPMVLIKTVHKMDGLIHPDQIYTQPGGNGWYSVNHEYEGLRINVLGHGSLGFKTRRISDNRTDNVIETRFNQTWPFIGQVDYSSTYFNGQLQAESNSTLESLLLNNDQTVYPYIKSTTAGKYESGSWLSTSVKSVEVDTFGNTTTERVHATGPNNEFVEKLSVRSFSNDVNRWVLGLPVNATNTYKATGAQTTTHTMARTFNQDGLVVSETLEPNHASALTTRYHYDGFGNAVETTVTGGGQTRSTTTTYTADGRFMSSLTNPLGHTSTMKFSSLSGKQIRQTDPNGLVKETVYNDFDTVIKEQIKREDDPGQREIALPYWCESSTQPACPAQALYFVAALDDQGESPQTVYYDAYGREILKKSTGWKNKTVYQATEYDSMGRKVGASQPGYDLNNLNWTRSEYDSRDRVTKRISPEGGEVTYSYGTLSNSITNALGQTTTVVQNLQGKPVKSIDNAGSSTHYSYDAEGKLLTTTDSMGNRIESRYDVFGRKTFMDDPDMGQWSYEYDAFGNMTKQTDAKGQVVTMQYDALNRIVKRTELEGDTNWVYDTANLGDFGQAKGMLHYVSGSDGYVRSHFYDRFSRPIKEQTTIKNKTYTTERGYYLASDKVDWLKYPSGLVMRTEYDEYGFAKKLNSVNLDNIKAYNDAYDKYKKLHSDASELEAVSKDNLDHHKSKFDQFKALSEPKLDHIEDLYAQAKVIGKEADRLAALTNQNATHAKKYYNQYKTAYQSYDSNVKRARKLADSANWKLRTANYNVGMIKYHNNKINEHINYIKYELGNICNNVNAVLNGAECDVKKGTQEWRANAIRDIVVRHTGYIKMNQRKAAHFEMLYKQNVREYERLARESDKYARAARSYGNTAQAKLKLMNQYQARAKSYESKYKKEIAKYEAKAGKWKKRSQAGNSCIARDGEDPKSKYCLVKKGAAQKAEDAYYASNTYTQLVYHRDEYDRILKPLNAAIEAADAQSKITKDLEQQVLNSTTTYWETLEVAADGQIKSGRFGNGVESTWSYDEMGRTQRILAQLDNTDLQDMFFDYDAIGNLVSRQDDVDNLYETFGYDDLNRLTSSTLSGNGAEMYQMVGQQTQSFQYDSIGNLTYKSDVGQYTYGSGMASGSAGVHAVTSTSGDINASFSYDANGNQISGYGRTIQYNSFNKPVNISKNGAINEFMYSPERSMVYQLEKISGETKETRYVGGVFEETIKQGQTEAVHHLKVSKFTIAVLKTTPDLTAVKSTHYLHQDHLDSVVMITDADGEVVEKNHYDAFGKKRLAIIPGANQTIYSAGFLPFTDRSFTGHRYMPGQELVNMKGRMYDPTFGRFLSADPHIQSPLNSQSLNRYSYVLNNPLSLNDPTGYFFSALKKLWKKIKRLVKKIIKKVVAIIMKVINFAIKMIPIKPIRNIVQKYWQPILIAAATIIPFLQPALPFIKLGLAYFNAAASFANGGSLTQILGSLAIQLAMPGDFKGLSGLKNSIFGSIAKGISWVSNSIAGTIAKLGGPFVALSGFVGVAINSGIQSKIFGGSFSKAFKSSLSSQLRGTVFTAAIGAGYNLVRSPADNLSKYSTQNELAENVYDVKKGDKINGFTAEEVWDHKLNKSLPSGLKAALYSNGTDKYLVFAGTNDGGDWLANIMQAFGFRTRQYDFAERLGNIYGDTVHYIGHSLGGGLAATASIAGGGSATIFNAAGLSPLNFNDDNDITHVVSNADLLQLVNSLTPVQVPGDTVPAGVAGIHGIGAMCGATGGNCGN